MRKSWVDFQRRLLQEFRGQGACRNDWHDLISVTMQDEDGDVDLLQVFGEISFREGLNAVIAGLDAAHHSLEPPVLADALRDFCAGTVVTVERESDVPIELRAIGCECNAKIVEDRDRVGRLDSCRF